MTDNEVNKIIAEFIGWEKEEFVDDGFWGVDDQRPSCQYRLDNKISYENPPSYFSLDALVPVWEKLCEHVNILEIRCNQDFSKNKHWFYFKYCNFEENGQEVRGSIQQAAARATAKAILELKE